MGNRFVSFGPLQDELAHFDVNCSGGRAETVTCDMPGGTASLVIRRALAVVLITWFPRLLFSPVQGLVSGR